MWWYGHILNMKTEFQTTFGT